MTRRPPFFLHIEKRWPLLLLCDSYVSIPLIFLQLGVLAATNEERAQIRAPYFWVCRLWWMAACWLCSVTVAKQGHSQPSNTNTAFRQSISSHTRTHTNPGTEHGSDWTGVMRVPEFPVGRGPNELSITMTAGESALTARSLDGTCSPNKNRGRLSSPFTPLPW